MDVLDATAAAARPSGRASRATLRSAVIVALMGVGLVLIGIASFAIVDEVDVEEQLTWLLGAAIPGFALVAIGGVVLAAGELRRFSDRVEGTADRLQVLHTRLSRAAGGTLPRRTASSTDSAMPFGGRLAVVAGGVSYHRPDCVVLHGKDGVSTRSRARLAADLRPCVVCEPDGS